MFSCRMKLGNLLCLKYLQCKGLRQPSGAILTAKMKDMRAAFQPGKDTLRKFVCPPNDKAAQRTACFTADSQLRKDTFGATTRQTAAIVIAASSVIPGNIQSVLQAQKAGGSPDLETLGSSPVSLCAPRHDAVRRVVINELIPEPSHGMLRHQNSILGITSLG